MFTNFKNEKNKKTLRKQSKELDKAENTHPPNLIDLKCLRSQGLFYIFLSLGHLQHAALLWLQILSSLREAYPTVELVVSEDICPRHHVPSPSQKKKACPKRKAFSKWTN